MNDEDFCEDCGQELEEDKPCACHFCDDCGEELNQWGSCPNRCHMSESEKRTDDLNTIGCQQSHAEREEADWYD